MHPGSPLAWSVFAAIVAVMLALDLGVFHRRAHAVGNREAVTWSLVWITLSMLFGGGIWWMFGGDAAVLYVTGWVIEKSLSVDNLFVFVLIFSALKIPAEQQHKILFWGVLTAIVLRGLMIVGGGAALERFHWLTYVFGGFLVFTGLRLLWSWRSREETHPEKSWPMRIVRRLIPATATLDGARFFTLENGRRLATPLFVALILIEISDVIFALDSIPAILAITTDPFLVLTSNVFAMLGLRSLFFLLAGMLGRFHYLKVGLAAILLFVGSKMVMADVIHITPAISLLVVAMTLGLAIAASLRRSGASGGAAARRTPTP